MVLEEKKVKNICNFYVSEYHLEIMLLPYISKKIDNEENITIEAIQNAIGVQITDDNDKPVEFENNIQGIKSYVDSVIEASRDEHYETAINNITFSKLTKIKRSTDYYLQTKNLDVAFCIDAIIIDDKDITFLENITI